jgi:DNA-binding beta-propeller fold protein YncE
MDNLSRSAIAMFAVLLACKLATFQAYAQLGAKPSVCNQPAPEAISFVDVPGHPFTPIPTRDGCWIFVSLENSKNGPPSGVAVLQRSHGTVSLSRVIPTDRGPAGMVLTHDGQLLIGAVDDRLVFLDTSRMISGEGSAVLGYLREPEYHGELGEMKVTTPGAVYVNVTSDDRLLLASDEWAQRITVVNLEKARDSGFSADSIIGTIPTGGLPIAIALSHDERYLYTTSETAAKEWGWPIECKPEGQDPSKAKAEYPQGAVVVIDVAKARKDPTNSVIAKVPAGCSAVRLATSPKGDRIYVTARNANSLFVFDASKLLRDPDHSLVGKVPVGSSPVGVEVVDAGQKVVVANSNRFAATSNDKQNLTVIDAGKVRAGAIATLGVIPAGGFPRELRITADGLALLVTNFSSNTLEIVDLARLRMKPLSSESKAPPGR